MRKYTKIGIEVGELVDRKNDAYGSSFAKAGDFLALLWPEGLEPERYTDALLMVRIFDKQMRIATDRDAFGESPYRDIAGYGLLGSALHEERNGECGTASAAAEDEPKEQHASQPRSVPPQTITSDAATKPKSSSGGCFPPHASSSLNAALQAAFAQGATANAPDAEADLPLSPAWKFEEAKKLWKARSVQGHCAYCDEAIASRNIPVLVTIDGGIWEFDVHSFCLSHFKKRISDWDDAIAAGTVIR